MTARDDINVLKHAGAAEPIKPEPPEPFELDTEPMPWPADCLPGLMQQAADAIAEHVQVPGALAGFAVLSAVAHVAQRITDADMPKVGRKPCSLFLLALADSGDRKSTAFDVASKPVSQAEAEARQRHKRLADEIARQAADAKASERESILADTPRDPRTIYVESTLPRITSDLVKGSRPALSWSTDEGAQFFGGHTMKSDTRAEALGTLVRLYDGKGVDRDRVGPDSGSGVRYNVRFGVFLSAQQAAVAPSLHDPLLRGQGLLPRFLLAAPASMAGQRFMTDDNLARRLDADPSIGHYWQVLRRMNDQPEKTDEHGGLALPVATLTHEAARVWIDFYNTTEARLDPFTGDLVEGLKPFGSRAAENAARVAAVFAAWRHFESGTGDLAVTGDDMRRACLLVDYSLAEWQRLSERTVLSTSERDALELLQFLQRDPMKWARFTRQRLAQSGPSQLRKEKDRRNAALTELVQRRWMTYDGERFQLRVTQETPIATATSATSATSAAFAGVKSSKSSESSSSKPPKPDFSEETDQADDSSQPTPGFWNHIEQPIEAPEPPTSGDWWSEYTEMDAADTRPAAPDDIVEEEF